MRFLFAILTLSFTTFATFALTPSEESFLKGFLVGYRQGYEDALSKIQTETKVVKKLQKETRILDKLLKNQQYRKYLYLYKTKCGKEYYLFLPQDAKDFPDLLKVSEELKKQLKIPEGYYVFIHTSELPTEIVGLLKYLAIQKGFNPFFVKDLLVFAVEPTEASASYDTEVLNKLFQKYLKVGVRTVYKYISPKTNDVDLLLKTENWSP